MIDIRGITSRPSRARELKPIVAQHDREMALVAPLAGA